MIEAKSALSDHPIIPEIANRWSPRAFNKKMVEQEKLLRLLEALRWGASSRNEQPWRMIIARQGEPHYDKLFEALDDGNKEWAFTAPVLGATLAARHFARNGRENNLHRHDLGLAMGGLLAQATHEGLHVHQMAGFDPEVVYRNFEVDKSAYDAVAMFVIGYQDEQRLDELPEKHREPELKPRTRKALKELVFGNTFGENPDWIK